MGLSIGLVWEQKQLMREVGNCTVYQSTRIREVENCMFQPTMDRYGIETVSELLKISRPIRASKSAAPSSPITCASIHLDPHHRSPILTCHLFTYTISLQQKKSYILKTLY